MIHTYHVLTEWKLQTKASEIPIHLYWMPQKHMEAVAIEKEIGKLKYAVSKANGFMIVESSSYLLGSFEEIRDWGDVRPLDYDYRPINLTSFIERRLLERLLSRSLEKAQDPQRFKVARRRNESVLYSRQDHEKLGDFEVSRVLHLDMTVCPRGSITVGFDLSHEFTHPKNLYELLKEQSSLLTPGCKVKDIVKQNTYVFKEVLDKTISDPLETGQNLFDYYRNQGLGWYVKDIPPETPAVACEDGHGQVWTFIPQLLRVVCTWENIPTEIKQKAKMKPTERMEALISMMSKVLEAWKQKTKYFSIRYDKPGLLTVQNGYRVTKLKRPVLEFGKGVKGNSVFKSLQEGGVLTPTSRPFEVQFLVDNEIAKPFTDRRPNGEYYFPFFEDLANLSQRLGVPLAQPDWGSRRIVRIHFDDPLSFRMKLRQIAENMQLDHPILVVAKESNLKKKIGPDQSDYYTLLKRELVREHGFHTQVVTFETFNQIKKKNKKNEKEYILMNILLGIYVKLGIHPWRLREPLHSECLVGLDVCHDDDIHTTGIIQVVGQDGLPLWTKPHPNIEKGEVIRRETLEETVFQTLVKFKQRNGRLPKHLTFHRDGLDHEAEIQVIRELLAPQNIRFDYVSIRKKVNRRMTYKTGKEEPWKNATGYAYVKDTERTAFLCTTSPHESIGMSRPIRVTQLTDCLTFNQILDDVYRLTFMNVHAINPSRLPVTINYADKTASFFARGMLPLDKELPIQSV